VRECRHKLYVTYILPSCPPIQILHCSRCDKPFYGFGGTKGKPEYIHPIKKVDNPLWFKNVDEKSTQNVLQEQL